MHRIKKQYLLMVILSFFVGGGQCSKTEECCNKVSKFLRDKRRTAELGTQDKEEASQALDAFSYVSNKVQKGKKLKARNEDLLAQNKRLYAVQQDTQSEVHRLRRQKQQDEKHAEKAAGLHNRVQVLESEKHALEGRVHQLEQENQHLKKAHELLPLVAQAPKPTGAAATSTPVAGPDVPVQC